MTGPRVAAPVSVDAALAALALPWAAYWPGLDLEAVAADARARLGAAVRAWGLERASPLGGGNVALVCAAERSGRAVVVKVQPRSELREALLAEADALAFWQGTGAVVPLLELRDDGATLLLARLVPGGTLDGAALPYGARLDVLGGLAARLHGAGTPPPSTWGLEDTSRSWRRALVGEPGLLALLDDLEGSTREEVMTHGDLHGGNALDDAGSWRAIDPKGVRADRHLDVWGLMDPAVPDLPADPAEAAERAAARVERYARAAGLEPARASAWLVVRARAQALATDARRAAGPADRAWAARLHRLAGALGAPPLVGAHVRAERAPTRGGPPLPYPLPR